MWGYSRGVSQPNSSSSTSGDEVFSSSFVLTSDAFVVVPGGIGTVLELMMIWQLLQVKQISGTPLILVGKMWAGLVDWARSELLRPELQLANLNDMTIPQCVDTADEAIV
jgi:predicted Rossmann-fold nucleotide-binding protein